MFQLKGYINKVAYMGMQKTVNAIFVTQSPIHA